MDQVLHLTKNEALAEESQFVVPLFSSKEVSPKIPKYKKKYENK